MKADFLTQCEESVYPYMEAHDNERKKNLVTAFVLTLLQTIIALGLYKLSIILNQEWLLKVTLTLFILTFPAWRFVKKHFENKIKWI